MKNFFLVLLHYNFIQIKVKTKKINDSPASEYKGLEVIECLHAVMKPESLRGNVYTHPADFGWSDLGNWQSLHEKLQKDANNNAVVGNVSLFECSNCVVPFEGKPTLSSHP